MIMLFLVFVFVFVMLIFVIIMGMNQAIEVFCLAPNGCKPELSFDSETAVVF